MIYDNWTWRDAWAANDEQIRKAMYEMRWGKDRPLCCGDRGMAKDGSGSKAHYKCFACNRRITWRQGTIFSDSLLTARKAIAFALMARDCDWVFSEVADVTGVAWLTFDRWRDRLQGRWETGSFNFGWRRDVRLNGEVPNRQKVADFLAQHRAVRPSELQIAFIHCDKNLLKRMHRSLANFDKNTLRKIAQGRNPIKEAQVEILAFYQHLIPCPLDEFH